MNKTPRQWPHDYHAWTGSFADLVSAAAEVMASLDPQTKAPTERALRDYQQRGLLGRGTKVGGNRSVFSFEDLDRVVATKGLVGQKFTLDHAESLLNSASMHQGSVSDMVYASSSTKAYTGNLGGSLEMSAPSDASGLVARLMAKSPSPVVAAPVFQGFAKAAPASKAAQPRGVSGRTETYTATSVEALRPASWLTIYLDPSVAQGAPDEERAQARAALQSVLDRLG